MSEALASPAKVTVKTVYKACNVTVVADGLQATALDPTIFAEFGPSKTFVQMGPIAVIQFEQHSLVVEVNSKRAVAADTSGERTGVVAELMQRYLAKVPKAQISAVGFNYVFELVFDGEAVNFAEKFLNRESAVRIGGPVVAAGFKLMQRRGPYLRQLIVDPVWNNANLLTVSVNFHLEAPLEKTLSISNRFAECAAEAPELIESVIDV